MDRFPCIIQVNDDLSSSVQQTLVTQLYITEAITGTEFDARVAADPNYPLIVYQNNLRILVIRPANDYTNRFLADLVLFLKHGEASIQCNKTGEPTKTVQIAYINLGKLMLWYPRLVECCNAFCDGYQMYPNDGYLPIHIDGYCCPPFPCPPVQNNIVCPLFPYSKIPAKFPFGSDPDRRQDTIFNTMPYVPFHNQGALIPLKPCTCSCSPCRCCDFGCGK